MRRAILVRHGESAYSARGALNGDANAVCGLTDEGREQAGRLGATLRDEPIDLCVVTEFQRVRETADEALAGRDVPRLVVPELNDPRFGRFEGCHIDEYRAWAEGVASSELPGEDGECRHAIVERYTRGFRKLLARPEETILLVAHSLPLAYLSGAHEGGEPGARMPLVPYAEPYELHADELERAIERLEAWVKAPTW